MVNLEIFGLGRKFRLMWAVLPEIQDFPDLDLRDELHELGAENGAGIDGFEG
jgi:hypothetical protein